MAAQEASTGSGRAPEQLQREDQSLSKGRVSGQSSVEGGGELAVQEARLRGIWSSAGVCKTDIWPR